MRRLAVLFVLIVAFAFTATGHASFQPAQAAALPNVVVIMTDDMRWDELDNMPTVLNQLVAHGVKFDEGFMPNPLCCPSRSTAFTGQFSNTNNVWRNSSPYGGYKTFLPHETNTVATALNSVGYTTGLVGKYMNGYNAKNAGGLAPPPGWDSWVAFLGGSATAEPAAYYKYTLDVQGTTQSFDSAATDYSTDVLGSYATSFVQQAPTDAPWFLYFAPYAPHTPFTPAPRYATALPKCTNGATPPGCYQEVSYPNINEVDVSDKPAWVQALRLRKGSIDPNRLAQERALLAVDDQIANILAAVEARGELANTMFVFTSDNSLSGGAHRWAGKQSPWDEAIHVPLLVRFDPLTSGTVDTSHMVLNADLAPTLYQLAGLPPDPAFDGQSWLPLLSDQTAPWRTAFPLEHLAEGSINPPSTTPPPTFCGVRTDGAAEIPGRWMYVRYVTGEEEMYDLIQDPWQMQSLQADAGYQTQLQALRALAQTLCDPPPPGFTWPPSGA